MTETDAVPDAETDDGRSLSFYLVVVTSASTQYSTPVHYHFTLHFTLTLYIIILPKLEYQEGQSKKRRK